MRLIRQTGKRLLFQLGRRETAMLLQVLKLYPCVPPAHHALTKSSGLPDQEANQQLLNDALAEQRAENKKQLLALLDDRQRFARTQAGARLSLPPGDLEWLLQVLNDIRVGSWIRLGSPEEKPSEVDETSAPNLLAMEMAGYFQAQLLEATQGRT